MKEDSKITYWLEIREFRKEIKKVVIPYDKFFTNSKKYTNYEDNKELFSSTIKS